MEILKADIIIDYIHQFGVWEFSDMLLLRYNTLRNTSPLDFISENKIHRLMSSHSFANYEYTISIDRDVVSEITLQSIF